MAGVNKVILIGNLGRDPEVRYTGAGTAVANFTLATTENWTDKSGNKQERTEWHRIVVWGRTAELCGEYLAKGRQVYLEGRLQTREWTDKENRKQFTTEIVANQVVFLRDGSGATAGSGGAPAATRNPVAAGAPASPDEFGPPPQGFDEPAAGGGRNDGGPGDDDIPF